MTPDRSPFAVPLVILLVASTFSAAALIDAGVGPDLVPDPADAAAASDGHEATTITVDGAGDVPIEVTVFRPAQASAQDPVPVLLHGHGWGGENWENESQAQAFLDAGFGVASIDQRGHGDSGGQARVMSPDHEAEDVKAVLDTLAQGAQFDWIETEGPDDPVAGAIGGSYGGGYQLVTALDETEETGETRLDALAPEITWFDLTRSLAPNGVVKSEWVDALVAVAKAPPVTDTHPDYVDEPYAYTTATGDLPDEETPGIMDIATVYRQHSPRGFVDRGVQLDVPVLLQQGMSDTLFPLDQALANYQETLSPEARDDSYVVAHTTGHVLPSFGPPPGRLQEPQGGSTPCADDIAGSKTDLLVQWFNHTLRGDETATLPSDPITMVREDGTCLSLEAVPAAETPVMPEDPTVTVSGPAGPPNLVALDEATGTVAGSPSLEATATTGSADTRFFVGLAVGPSPAEASVVHSQWRPVHLEGPATDAPVAVDLPDVAFDVDEDETLYLATATTLDMYVHHGSRTPGPVVLEDVQVTLPTTDAAP